MSKKENINPFGILSKTEPAVKVEFTPEIQAIIQQQVELALKSHQSSSSAPNISNITVEQLFEAFRLHSPSNPGSAIPLRINGLEPQRYAGDHGRVCMLWVKKMASYVELLKSREPSLAPSVVGDIVITYLDGSAFELVTRMKEQNGGVIEWSNIKQALLERFGVIRSLYSWLKDLSAIQKSPDMSIAAYSLKFEEELDVLMCSGFDNALVAVTYFIDGLDRVFREALLHSLLSQPVDPLVALSKKTSCDAIRELVVLARRCEDVNMLLSKAAPSARLNAVATTISSSRQRYTREETVAHMAKKYGVSVVVVDQRIKLKHCIPCGAADHMATDCPVWKQKLAQSSSAPSASGSSSN